MNLQEREQLNLFLQQLMQVQASQKDSDADMLIRDACARQPDAGYLLVQRAMQLEHALQSMKAQCDQQQSELDKTRLGTQSSFLNDANAWGTSAVAATAPSAPVAAILRSTVQQPRAQVSGPAPAAPAHSSWGSGILGTVATTAAGVVAGSFLFQGFGNLMGHHNETGAVGSKTAANTASPAADNSVIDNYFDGSSKDEAPALADAGSDFGGDDMT